MRIRSTLLYPFFTAALLIGMVVLWTLLAPIQFGGQASYVIIAGASMEPSLHSGDLVVARQSNSYVVGDVVTYSHPQVGPVIHRIINKAGDTYILQGDNNEWIDSYQPTNDAVLGKAWITLPGAAKALKQLRTPLGLVLLSVSLGLMVLITVARGRSDEENQQEQMKGTRVVTPTNTISEVREGWTLPFLTILLGGFLLGVFAFSKPILESVSTDVPYQHRGEFSYHAKAPASVYDDGIIETGDAIFHSIVNKIKVIFEYEFDAPGARQISGEYQIFLELSEPNGWRRQIELIPSTAFTENAFTASATMDITRIKWLIGHLRQRTNFNRGAFDLRIIPIVNLNANLEGQHIEDRFAPALHFKLDDFQLYMNGSSAFDENKDPLKPLEIKIVKQFQQVPATLTVLGLEMKVETARWIAGVSVAVALVGLTYILYPLLQSWRQGESSRIALNYGELLVEVDKLPKTKLTQTFDVSSFSDLAKIAQSLKVLILHQFKSNTHTYLLQVNEAAYRFSLSEENKEEGK